MHAALAKLNVNPEILWLKFLQSMGKSKGLTEDKLYSRGIGLMKLGIKKGTIAEFWRKP